MFKSVFIANINMWHHLVVLLCYNVALVISQSCPDKYPPGMETVYRTSVFDMNTRYCLYIIYNTSTYEQSRSYCHQMNTTTMYTLTYASFQTAFRSAAVAAGMISDADPMYVFPLHYQNIEHYGQPHYYYAGTASYDCEIDHHCTASFVICIDAGATPIYTTGSTTSTDSASSAPMKMANATTHQATATMTNPTTESITLQTTQFSSATTTPANTKRCPVASCGPSAPPVTKCATSFHPIDGSCIFANTDGTYGYRPRSPFDAMVRCSKGLLDFGASISIEPSPYPSVFTSQSALLDVLDNQVIYDYYPVINQPYYPLLVIGASKLQDGNSRWADGSPFDHFKIDWLSPLTNPSGQCIVVRVVGQNTQYNDPSNYRFDLVDCFTPDAAYLGTICSHSLNGHTCLDGNRLGYNNTCYDVTMSTTRPSVIDQLAVPTTLRETFHLRNLAEKCYDSSYGGLGISLGQVPYNVLNNGLLPVDSKFEQCLLWFFGKAVCPDVYTTIQSCIHIISCKSGCYKAIYECQALRIDASYYNIAEK